MAMRPMSFGTDESSSGRSTTRSIATATNYSKRSPMIPARPVTGTGGLARQRTMPKEMYESAGYYSNLLKQKSQEIIEEMQRLERETEMADSTSDIHVRHNNVVKDIRQLEAALADINLAKEKERAGYNYEDIREETVGILNGNKALEREVSSFPVAFKLLHY